MVSGVRKSGRCAEPELILRAIAATLHLPPATDGNELDGLVRYIQSLPLLLILDNFEQLMPGGSFVVEQLLTRLPTLSVLVTSRHRLAIPGERVYNVEPLSEANSALLFVDRRRPSVPIFSAHT